MTGQEIFDKVCAHLAQQKRRAVMPGTKGCRYLTGEGLMCAVGCLFDDRELEEYGGTLGAVGDLARSATRVGDQRTFAWLNEHRVLLHHLQGAHDEPDQQPIELRVRLREVAAYSDLDPAAADLITEWAA